MLWSSRTFTLLSFIRVFHTTSNRRHFDASIKIHVKLYSAILSLKQRICEGFTLKMITRSLSLDYARILFLVMNPLILKVVFLECRTHDNFQWSSSVRLACVMISSTFWLPVLVSGTEREREGIITYQRTFIASNINTLKQYAVRRLLSKGGLTLRRSFKDHVLVQSNSFEVNQPSTQRRSSSFVCDNSLLSLWLATLNM